MMTLFHKFFGLIYVLLERRDADILICRQKNLHLRLACGSRSRCIIGQITLTTKCPLINNALLIDSIGADLECTVE